MGGRGHKIVIHDALVSIKLRGMNMATHQHWYTYTQDHNREGNYYRKKIGASA